MTIETVLLQIIIIIIIRVTLVPISIRIPEHRHSHSILVADLITHIKGDHSQREIPIIKIRQICMQLQQIMVAHIIQISQALRISQAAVKGQGVKGLADQVHNL